MLGDVVEVLAVAMLAEYRRVTMGPARLVLMQRARGRMRRERNGNERRRLRTIIGLVDRGFPSGGNCYRRALIELALDSGAAKEPLHFGLKAHGGPGSGHAWLGQDADEAAQYDAQIDM